MQRIKALFFMLLTLVWLGIIYTFSMQPAVESTTTSQGLIKSLVEMFLPWWVDELNTMPAADIAVLDMLVRKVAHLVEYMILGVLMMLTLSYREGYYRARNGITFCFLAAIVDELIQTFVDGRVGRIIDVVIDSIGAIIGVLIVVWTIQDRMLEE